MVTRLMRSMKRKFLSCDNSALSIKMINFGKDVNCPASEDLLAFQAHGMTQRDAGEIRKHLETCEFCAAEIEFYAHVPQTEETVSTCEIPQPLFELAEALLSTGQRKFSLLNKLLNESEGLSLNKA